MEYAHCGQEVMLDPRDRGDLWLPPTPSETMFYMKFAMHPELHSLNRYHRSLVSSLRHFRCCDEEMVEATARQAQKAYHRSIGRDGSTTGESGSASATTGLLNDWSTPSLVSSGGRALLNVLHG